MNEIAQVLNKNFSLHTGATQGDLTEHILSEINCLKQKIEELDCPKFRELIALAEAWQGFERELRGLEDTIRKYAAKKSISPLDEFLRKLRKKN
jgi:hypothetical protein